MSIRTTSGLERARLRHGTDIYVVGGLLGDDPGPPVSNVWRYDTKADTWTAAPSLPARRGAGAAAIVGSTIHFFAGNDRLAGPYDYVDMADHWSLDVSAANPRWVARAPMPGVRNHLGGVAFGGKVYAVGGQRLRDERNGNLARVDVYDPKADTWSRAADLPVPRGTSPRRCFRWVIA